VQRIKLSKLHRKMSVRQCSHPSYNMLLIQTNWYHRTTRLYIALESG